MRKRIMRIVLMFLASTAFTGCFTDRGGVGGGIMSIPPRTDPNTPGIEYRVLEINGKVYTATRNRYWPGGDQEKWNLVGPIN